MKGGTPRITLLGNNAGRNLGDMAILSSILHSLTRRLPGARFYVPSTNPRWTRRHYGKRFNVRALSVMPWTGSIRLLGLPTLGAFAFSDVVMICDGIIFGNMLFNPAFNYLITLVVLAPLARLCGCRLVCYSCGFGPFPTKISRLLARWTINRCDLVMVRERDSERLAREVGVTRPIEVTGDAAFINPVSSDQRAVAILRELGVDPDAPLFAINITAYLDRWLDAGEKMSRDMDFVATVAAGIRRAQAESAAQFVPLVICTQPMDEETCGRLAAQIGAKVLSNAHYLSHDIQAVMRRCQLMMGMRFHSIVLASAVETPVIALNYAPKVRGYMRMLGCERFGMELTGVTPHTLALKIGEAWATRADLRAQQVEVVRQQKHGAERAADLLAARYFKDAMRPPAHARARDRVARAGDDSRDLADPVWTAPNAH